MINQEIAAYGEAKGWHKQTLDRWLKLAETDREAFWSLVRELKLGENHLKDFLDWLEEISLRDGVSICDVLNGKSLQRISSDPRLGRNDKLKQIKEELRRLRFPRLARIEEEIRKRIHELRLGPKIQITAPLALEGSGLAVQMKAASYEELGRLVGELREAMEKKAVKEIFALLGGGGDERF